MPPAKKQPLQVDDGDSVAYKQRIIDLFAQMDRLNGDLDRAESQKLTVIEQSQELTKSLQQISPGTGSSVGPLAASSSGGPLASSPIGGPLAASSSGGSGGPLAASSSGGWPNPEIVYEEEKERQRLRV